MERRFIGETRLRNLLIWFLLSVGDALAFLFGDLHVGVVVWMSIIDDYNI